MYPNFKHLILEGRKPVYFFCKALRNHPTESMNFRMNKCEEMKRNEQRRTESLELTGSSPVSQSQRSNCKDFRENSTVPDGGADGGAAPSCEQPWEIKR